MENFAQAKVRVSTCFLFGEEAQHLDVGVANYGDNIPPVIKAVELVLLELY